MGTDEKTRLPSIAQSLLPLIRDHVSQLGKGEALNDRIRKSIDMPSPLFFNLDGKPDELKEYGVFSKKLIKKYVYSRCLELEAAERNNVIGILMLLKKNHPKDWLLTKKLLGKTYSPTFDDFVLDWFKAYMPEQYNLEKQKWLVRMKHLQMLKNCEVSSVFLAFNLRLFILCSMSAKIYGDKYLPAQRPSPFIYAMV